MSDKLHEECGVFAIRLPEPADIPALVQMGIFALQHRGEEACGIAVASANEFRIDKDLGIVSHVFTEQRLAHLRFDTAHLGIGHTRYVTKGSNIRNDAGPLILHTKSGSLALSHNGGFTNASEIKADLLARGISFQTTNESEVMLKLIASTPDLPTADAIASAMHQLTGGFSVTLMDNEHIYAARDRHGIRPLVIGALAGGYVFASEVGALNVIGAQFVREVRHGELVIAGPNGLESRQVLPSTPAPCAFEWIYFARGDSRMDGVEVHDARLRLGAELAREMPVDADIVVGVPESGLTAAIGYARASGIPYDAGLYRSPYAGRTFINPTPRLRDRKVQVKFGATAAVRGKRVVLVDDSVVRGTTSGRIVNLLREAGATEVHFRVSSPPVKYPCFYGIDTAARKDLAAAKMSTAQIQDRIGADSLAFLSEASLKRALTLNELCLACFNGEYPAGNITDPHQ